MNVFYTGISAAILSTFFSLTAYGTFAAILPIPPAPPMSRAGHPGISILSLETEYGISISRQDEKAGIYMKNANYKISCREPSIIELEHLALALQKSKPAQRGKRARNLGVKFYFLRQPLCCGARADWSLDHTGRAAIFVEPEYSEKELTYTFIHELAHNSAYRLGYNIEDPSAWRMARRLGWTMFNNPDTGEQGWSIRLKNSHTYKKSSVFSSWVRVDGSGRPLDRSGMRVKRQSEAAQLTPFMIMQEAQVRPITTYFPNPMEVYAEGLAHYRASDSMRNFLAEQSPDLYQLIEAEHRRDCQLSGTQ